MRIFIKGFKSIAEGQYVAFGKKLTFLVGPNSAGKSAVYSAISRLRSEAPLFDLDIPALHHKQHESKWGLVQSLGVEWEDGSDVLEHRTTYLLYGFVDGEEIIPESSFNSRLENSYQDYGDYFRQRVDGDYFYRYLNVNSYLKNFTLDFAKIHHFRSDGMRMATNLGRMFEWEYDFYEGGLYNLQEESGGGIFFDAIKFIKDVVPHNFSETPSADFEGLAAVGDFIKSINSFANHRRLHWSINILKDVIAAVASGEKKQKNLNQFYHHDAKLKRYEKKVLEQLALRNPWRGIRLVLVSADRVLPFGDDLRAMVVKEKSNNCYHLLMRSFVEREWNFDFEMNSYWNSGRRGVFAEKVNNALASELFIDNGYQIVVSSSIVASRDQVKIVPIDQSDEHVSQGSRYLVEGDETSFLAEMNLKDSHGRTLRFDEVGSGIGYVLPILIEAFNPDNKGGMVFLQQPELHLHPALQASLTDVLIQAASDRHIVAETHSEHLILRALKRIRQTYNETLLDKDLKLTHEDVAVNYFEPLPDGSTKVHIIRIAPDGEFIDRWPNGFFAERDQELFDE